MTRTCTKCHTEKPLEDFAKGPRVPWCKECMRPYGRANYQENKERYYANAKKRDKQLDKLINEAKDVPCADCKVKYSPYVMDFDHLDPTQKEFSIAKMRRRRMAFSRIVAEITKCEVVCANCHRERTSGPSGQNPARYTGDF